MPESPIDPHAPMVGAEEALTTTVRNAPQATFVVSPGGTIRAGNGFAAAALGYDDATQMAGASVPQDRVLEPATSGKVLERDLDHFAARDGTPVRVAFAAVPVDLPEGRGVAVAFTSVVEDDDDDARAFAPARVASLRRVARAIADAVGAFRVFATIATEVGRMSGLPMLHILRVDPDGTVLILGAWSDPPCGVGPGARLALADVPGSAEVARTHAIVRVPDLSALPGDVTAALRAEGIGAVIATPAVYEDRVWGILLSGQVTGRPLPDDIEERMAPFGALVATRAADMLGRRELARLADEQAALRRVATLVAQDVAPAELFAAVTRELGLLLGVDLAHMSRYEPDGVAVGVATWAMRGEPIPREVRAPDDGENIASLVWRTGQPAARSRREPFPEYIASVLSNNDIQTRVGAPIVVGGRVWGLMVVLVVDDQRLPSDVGERVAAFSELVATAIANSEARAERSRLADEQEALRYVATLVARDVPAEELFSEATTTVGRLLDADMAGMTRYVNDDHLTPIATWSADGTHVPVSGVWPIEAGDFADTLRRAGRPTRMDGWEDVDGAVGSFIRDEMQVRCTVGAPIVVRGEPWGGLFVHSRTVDGLPPGTEARIGRFAELIASALANGEAHEALRRMADEQAALRRVATLVAHGASADAVFAAVGEELGLLMWSSPTQIVRFDGGNEATVLAGWGDAVTPANTTISIAGDNVSSLVHRHGRPVRISEDEWSGPLGDYARSFGLKSGVGAPILVDGRVWGAMTVVTRDPEAFPPDTEARVESFTELIAAAVSNIEAHASLAASRARVVAAADDERQRVVRDLHDGAQQRLVHTVITLKLALGQLAPGAGRELVEEALAQSEQATDELRDLAHGILPAVLTDGGLPAAVAAIASRMAIPVTIDVPSQRLDPAAEGTAYFVVSEGLTNVAKHAGAATAAVTATVETAPDGGSMLMVSVRDDGIGGAQDDGRGLLGLADRLAVVGGRIAVDSPLGRGTTVTAAIPLADAR